MRAVIGQFIAEEKVGAYRPFGGGHINDTYAVQDTDGVDRWVLQRINHHVFTKVDVLQRNVAVVAQTLREQLKQRGATDIERKYLHFLPLRTAPESNYYHDGENYWRMCTFIPDSKSLSELSEASARYVGEAFGEFEEILSVIPEGVLGDTIDNFHSMPFRLQQLDEAVAADPMGRVAGVQDILDEIKKRKDSMLIQEHLYAEGKLPKRTIHCDTKVDNILFDKGGEVLCVVDWDTVMPGFILSDVGDFIRTGVNLAPEDEPDLDKIGVNMPIYKAFVEGYISTAGKFLTETERSLIAYGGRLMTYMQTVRFLADYINGDTYFRVHHPEHNLQRTRAQLRFLECLEAATEEMEELLR
ncbi:MAG: aminoglycoside phosphotransferase family protein [Porphyromonadaceae bacterium]|nr:aminoglycoside phosphotransferase family protein [Porphyromonadaceae bacterium]